MNRDVKKNITHPIKRGVCLGWGDMKCFKNLMIVYGFVFYNILYGIMKL